MFLIKRFLGPALSGFIVTAFGFPAMLYIIAIICFLYAPLVIILKNPPAKEENLVSAHAILRINLICFFFLNEVINHK